MEDLRLIILRYSEWLDGEGIIADPKGWDARTHSDLVDQFFNEEL